MKITRVIDGVEKFLLVPIQNADQTVGVSISGTYNGQIKIVAMIDKDGQEFNLTPYASDGTVVDLSDPRPLDFFLDVGGFEAVRLIAETWVSGVANISAVTSAAPRKRNNAGGSDPSSQVEVINFPTTQAVSGPLTNVQLRSSPVDVNVTSVPENVSKDSSLQAILGQIIGYDSLGNLLPTMFNHTASQFIYDDDIIVSEIRVVGSETFTRTYQNNGEWVTSISAWVRS